MERDFVLGVVLWSVSLLILINAVNQNPSEVLSPHLLEC